MDDQQTDDREIIVLEHTAVERTKKLAEAVARKFAVMLFAVDQRLVQLQASGELTEVPNNVLRDLISQSFCTAQLAPDGDRWRLSLQPLQVDRQGLTDLTAALLLLVSPGPRKSQMIPDQIKAEVRMRAKSGEPPFDIEKSYRAYGVTREIIQQLRAA